MKGKKKLVIGISIVAVLIIAAVTIILLVNKKGAYRIIKIFEVSGTAVVTRDDIGEIEPYNNMVLESGDNIYLDKGKMTLRLDEDKYVYVEEQTEFELIAEGTAQDSKTKIELKQGAITNEIQNKLSDESYYEINTPNSTMSVRGTIYRVEIYEDENHVKYTKVSVFSGKVETKLVYKDGTLASKSVAVEPGKEVIIYEDDSTTDYLGDIRDIDYSELPEGALEILLTLSENGSDISITSDELQKYLDAKEQEGAKGPFTVTFMYNGNVFGTQTVEKGGYAQKPKLMPAETGNWDYDFSNPITEDTIINWK